MLVDVLARQIDAPGTLLALAISGGGARAVYFAFEIPGARRGGVRVAPPKVTLSTKPFANVASR